MQDYVYFDNSATTPLDPRVVDTMQPFLSGFFGNPSSLHGMGREARQSVENARRQVAGMLRVDPEEIVFTGSGTESDNMALCGSVGAVDTNCHIITSAIEHPAILETCRYLQQRGVDVSYLPVDSVGLVDPASLETVIRPTTRLVSVMAANNVVGTLQPIRELAHIAHQHGAFFHTDAVQAAGKVPVDVRTTQADLVSLSAHKIHGPKGVGALYVRKGVSLTPFIHGGGQEHGLRSATENVAGIVGFGEAARIAQETMSEEAARLVGLRDRLIEGLQSVFPNVYLIGHRYLRLPGHICIGFAGQEGEAIKMLLALDEAGIAVSTGSACSASHAHEPSYILLAMGFDPIRARGSLRITLGRFNTDDEVNRFLQVMRDIFPTLRRLTSYSL
ncbi:MAG: cysteine desulfurase [Candidatus Hydrogenedentes bacterium]|nr:cysteine desulfurase [Candidatus Hydrogenedentota bacterium]